MKFDKSEFLVRIQYVRKKQYKLTYHSVSHIINYVRIYDTIDIYKCVFACCYYQKLFVASLTSKLLNLYHIHAVLRRLHSACTLPEFYRSSFSKGSLEMKHLGIK